MAREKKFKQGDAVSWETPPGTTHGKVKKKLVADTHVKGTKISASASDPRYLVRSHKSGDEAAHEPEALERR